MGAQKDDFVPKILKWELKVSFIPNSVNFCKKLKTNNASSIESKQFLEVYEFIE